MTRRFLPLFLLLSFIVSGCAETVSRNETFDRSETLAQSETPAGPETPTRNDTPRILAMGDSMMAWHMATRRSISDAVATDLGEPVVNRSVSGARVLYALPISGAMGLKIAKQYKPGKWDWVVLNGGGNDLWLGCGCVACDGKMGRLISPNGRGGEIAKTVMNLRKTGAKVIYVGYLRSPGRGSIIEHCRDDGNELEARVARLADQVEGVHFLSLADLVPYGDRSYHSADMIHPSVKGSAAIGHAVAEIIRNSEG